MTDTPRKGGLLSSAAKNVFQTLQNSLGKLLAGSIAALLAGSHLSTVVMETRYDVVARNAAGQILWTETAFNRVVTTGLNTLLDSTFKTGNASPAWFIGLVGASISDGAITNADNTFTSATSPFATGDVGSDIIVRGAGTGGADLVTTIASRTGAGEVELTDAAGTTVTGAKAMWEARAADTMASHTPWVEVTAYSQTNRPAFTPGTIANGAVSNTDSQATYTINANNTLIFGLFLTTNSTKGGTTGTLYGMAPFTTSARQLNADDSLAVTATLTAASA